MERETGFGWALIGPGTVARRFAEAVRHVPDAGLRTVYGRDPARATAFAAACHDGLEKPPRVTRELAQILEDPQVDAVYVATPHARHGEFVRRCLAAGKPVLCEKPLVPTLAQGSTLVELANSRNLFLMEALWTRFLPVYGLIAGWLKGGAIGPVTAIRSSFCFRAPFEPAGRLYDPELAGGALLDLGVYNLSMTRWVIQQVTGTCPEPASIHAAAGFAATGVDTRMSVTLEFPGGPTSQFNCSLDDASENGLEILGRDGTIDVPCRFWEATAARLQRPGRPAEDVQAPFRVNGFEYEIEEVQRCVRAGLRESPRMTHADSLSVLGWMDEIRRKTALRYPFE